MMKMPVPSSYNDITTSRNLRDHVGAVWYQRTFFVPSSWRDQRIFIRFGSVNYLAQVVSIFYLQSNAKCDKLRTLKAYVQVNCKVLMRFISSFVRLQLVGERRLGDQPRNGPPALRSGNLVIFDLRWREPHYCRRR